MNNILSKLLPLILKLIPIIAAAWAARDFSVIDARGGFSTIQEILAVLIPSLVGVTAAGGAFYVDSQEKKAALMQEPPKPVGTTTHRITTPAMDISLSVPDVTLVTNVQLRNAFHVLADSAVPTTTTAKAVV